MFFLYSLKFFDFKISVKSYVLCGLGFFGMDTKESMGLNFTVMFCFKIFNCFLKAYLLNLSVYGLVAIFQFLYFNTYSAKRVCF